MGKLKLKDNLTENPRSILDENDDRTALSLSKETVRIDGSLEITQIPAGEHNTNQFLVLDGDTVKTRTGAEVLSDIGDEGGDVTQVTFVADDLGSATDTGGSADFLISGGEGIDTTASGVTVTISGENASTTNKGIVELATTAETTTGTDTARAVTPDGLKDGYEGSANVVTTGALDSGSITNGFGNINNGTSTLSTGAATLDHCTVAGDTLVDSDSDDNLLLLRQTLNSPSGDNAGMAVEQYAMIKSILTDTDSAGWDSVYHMNLVTGAASKFSVDKDGNVTTAGTITSSAGVSQGPNTWAHSCGGYKNNNSSSTIYYFQYYPNRYFWGNAESSPTSVSYTDLYSAEWQSPAAGKLTKIDAMVRASGAADDCTFYVYKATPSAGGNSSLSLTLIGDSGSCGIDSTTETFYKSAAISSSNTFSAGDLLFVMFKKDSSSASTTHTFTITISGEYT